MAVHRHVRAFDRTAALYELGRPGFPDAAVDRLAELLDLRPGRRVCDLAAGTGKLTRQLVPRGAEVVAVEPMPGMREVLGRRVPGVEVLDGTAESLPLADASVDAVTVAQAFHWFDPEPAMAEMDRVLRPGGRVAILWNVRDEDDPVEAAATRILQVHRDDAPSHAGLDMDAVVADSGFVEVERVVHAWQHRVPRQVFLARFLSVSFVAALDDDTKASVERALSELFDEHATGGRARHAYTFRAHVLARGA